MRYEKDIILFLGQNLIEKLEVCVNNARPNEACGLIFGTIKEIKLNEGFQYQYNAQKFECFDSDEKSPVAFLIENIELLNEVWQHAARKFNLQLISIFHSHHAGASPSGIDHENMIYLDDCGNRAFRNQIWTIMDAQNFHIKAFMYLNGEIIEIIIKIDK